MRSIPLELKRLHAEAAADPDLTEQRARRFMRASEPPATRDAAAWAHLALAACGLARAEVAATLDSLAAAIGFFDAADDDEGLLAALALLVNAWVMRGDRPEARATAGRALRLARRLGARATEARLLVNLAYTHVDDDDTLSYETLTCHALSLFEALEDASGVAHCLVNLGVALTRAGQWSDAQRHFDRAALVGATLDSPYLEALLWSGRGGLAMATGDWVRALDLYARCNLQLSAQGRDYHRLSQSLRVASELLALAQESAAESVLIATIEEATARGYDGLVVRAHEVSAALARARGARELEATHRAAARAAQARRPPPDSRGASATAAADVLAVLAALRAQTCDR